MALPGRAFRKRRRGTSSMTKTMSSMAEIVRVGGWGLRGLGYSYGVSERAVPMLAWTEAAVGGGMRSIRLAEQAIISSYAAPGLSVETAKDGTRHVQGHARHLIEVGPPAIDLATVDARKSGQGSLALTGAIGSNFVPALGNILANRQLSGAAVFKGDASTELKWLAFGPGYVGKPAPLGEAQLPEAILKGAAERGRIEKSWNEHVSQLRLAESSYLGLVVWKGEGQGPVEQADNLANRVRKAWTEGVETTLEDITYLYQLETRAWAPTSDRSRSQAGYGKF